MKRRDHPGQFTFGWLNPSNDAGSDLIPPANEVLPVTDSPQLWDFRTTFPPVTKEALDAGIIREEDTQLENLRAIHEEHAREALGTLWELDIVLDAKRRGVDPCTGQPPRTPQARERLSRLLQEEPARMQTAFESLMAVYCDAFGDVAAEAFTQAIRDWHTREGIPRR